MCEAADWLLQRRGGRETSFSRCVYSSGSRRKRKNILYPSSPPESIVSSSLNWNQTRLARDLGVLCRPLNLDSVVTRWDRCFSELPLDALLQNKPSVWTPPDPWALLWGEAVGDDLGFLARRCQLIFISSNQTVHFLSSSSLSPQRRQFPVSAAALPRLLPSSSAQEGSFHDFRRECDGLKTDDDVCVCVCSQPCGVSCFHLLWSRE